MQIGMLIINKFYLLYTATQQDFHSEVSCQNFVRIVWVAICILNTCLKKQTQIQSGN